MANVTNLAINVQSGTTSTLFASWEFANAKLTVTETKIKKGDTVTIKPGSTYYNGVDIPDWVEAKRWKVTEVSGNRVVLGKSDDGKNNINSPVHSKFLTRYNAADSAEAKVTLDHYTVKWHYATGDGIWFVGETSETEEKYALYDIPSNATQVKVTVTPVSKTYKSGGVDRAYWTGVGKSATYYASSNPPEQASAPTVSISDYYLTATLENISDPRADRIYFEIVKDTSVTKSSVFATPYSNVTTQKAAIRINVDAGYNYRVRCRAANDVSGKMVYGEWSSYSSQVATAPKAISNPKVSVDDEKSVWISWTKSSTATSYEVQYATNKKYFDVSQVSSTTSETNQVRISGLDTGLKWYFRIRAVNEQGNSDWSKIISTVVASKPSAPTTWSSTTTGIVGDKITLYWVHNSEDGSGMTRAAIKLTVNGESFTITKGYQENEDLSRIYSHELDLSNYDDGTEILWRVQTKGIGADYSDYSTQRSITVYAPPTIELHLGEDMRKWLWDTFNFEADSIYTAATGEYLECFPYDIKALSGPESTAPKAQVPVCYHINITAEDSYVTSDEMGSVTTVTAGSEVYSKTVYTNEYDFKMELLAGDLILENDQSYKVTVTVTMNSGLSASASDVFTVNWYEYLYDPDAELAVDRDTLSVNIVPFCHNDYGVLNDDVVMSVYRREYDGTFTEIATNLVNDGITAVVDPHPALDYARYRIVARNKNTSVCGFSDIPALPIKEPAIVIQWDEQWTSFDYSEEAEPVTHPWSGSLLRLPYNVDVSEKYAPDVSLVKYIGRKNPVSYYGTQRGETASWSTVVPKSDKEIIYALRRLSKWNGDVYVREPSGVGYWANITVSMSINHLQLTVPVSFTITRVEGGI